METSPTFAMISGYYRAAFRTRGFSCFRRLNRRVVSVSKILRSFLKIFRQLYGYKKSGDVIEG